MWLSLCRREWLLSWRRPQDFAQALIFLVLVVVIFPLATDLNALAEPSLALAILWNASLLSLLLGCDQLFNQDRDDGYLDQVRLGATLLVVYVVVKMVMQWLRTGLPVVLITPLVALMFGLPAQHWGLVMLTLALGSLAIIVLASLGAALTLGLARSGMLLALLILPLLVPVLIYGAGVGLAALQARDTLAPLAMLAALVLFYWALIPLAIAKVLSLTSS